MLLTPIIGGLLNNFGAVVDPTVTDDDTQGYAVGSLWVNTVNDSAFMAVTSATGAAIWDSINQNNIDGGSFGDTYLNTGNVDGGTF